MITFNNQTFENIGPATFITLQSTSDENQMIAFSEGPSI